jgi:hypothetical protein
VLLVDAESLKRFFFSLAFAGARVRASASDWLWFVCLKKKKYVLHNDSFAKIN